ncbi:MAG: methyltransferase domain-containing protein [Elusimicrobiota bacterium]
MDKQFLKLLKCPETGEDLVVSGNELTSSGGGRRYKLSSAGIPMFAAACFSPEGKIQEKHYNKVAAEYLENLGYSHTKYYISYLNRLLMKYFDKGKTVVAAEICCGDGEGLKMIGKTLELGVGVDVSCSMLEGAKRNLANGNVFFVQADATLLPLKDSSFDAAVLLGGIHHVINREKLFSEIYRILKPGGKLYWREPLNDFPLWKWLRYIVYRLSPALDSKTEAPLEYKLTKKQLNDAGISLKLWNTCGFLAFALFMNSDVLVITRLFRFVPGIEILVKMAAKFDEYLLNIDVFRNLGFLVIGMAEKRRQ